MTEYKKQGLIVITIFLFVVIQSGMLVAHLLGADLTINFNFKVTLIEEFIINLAIYIANLYFFIRISTRADKAFLKCLIFIPVYSAMWFLFPNNTVFMLLTIAYICLLFAITRKTKLLSFVLKTTLLSIITIAWQAATMIIKLNMQYYGNMDFLQNIILSIDYIIILYLIMKGVECNVWIQLVSFSKKRKFRMGRKACKQDEVNLTGKQKKVYWLLVMGTQVLQLFLLVYIGYRFNAVIELGVILIAFWVYRSFLGVSWHANTLLACTVLSIVFFICLSVKTIPVEASITITLLSAMGLAVVLHLYELKSNEVERKRNAIIKMADMVTPEKVIRYNARKNGLSTRHADTIIKREIEGKTVKQVAKEMDYGEQTIKKFSREYKNSFK